MAVSKVDAANQIENQLPQANIANNINFRNLIINGDMSIAQRSTSVTGKTSVEDYFTCDRMRFTTGNATFTLEQSTDVPSGYGFKNSFKADVTASATPAAGNFAMLRQRMEGNSLQFLNYNTSSAKKLTLSFWIKSTKTGTYIATLQNNSNPGRFVSQSYTVDTSDTWEKKTLTFDGDTASDIDNSNGNQFEVLLWLAAGSTYTSGTLQTSWDSVTNANYAVGQVNAYDSDSNNIFITGLQLEAGEVASDFEFLPHDVNYSRCIRYYHKVDDYYMGVTFNSSDGYASFYQSPVGMRGDIALESGGSYSVNGGSAGTPAIRTGAWQGQERVNFYNSASNWSGGALLEFSGAVSSEL